MQVYHNISYGKIVFYVFTILFHLYLLIRSASETQYFLAALLLIPVTAVTLVLIKFLKKSLISVFVGESSIQLSTAFETYYSNIGEINIEGSEIFTQGRKFNINLQKAEKLIQALNENKKGQ